MNKDLRPIDRRMFNGETQVEGDAWTDADSEKLEKYLTIRQANVDGPVDELLKKKADKSQDFTPSDELSLKMVKAKHDKITGENDYMADRLVLKADFGK